MTTIQIPATLEAAKTALGSLGALLTAKGWERAAILYAWTYEPGPVRKLESVRLTVPAFAALGIAGLRSTDTIYTHRRHWQYAIDHLGAIAPMPGQVVAVPQLDYPPVPPVKAKRAGSCPIVPTTAPNSVDTMRRFA